MRQVQVQVEVEAEVQVEASAWADACLAVEAEDQRLEGKRRREWIGGSGPPARDFPRGQLE